MPFLYKNNRYQLESNTHYIDLAEIYHNNKAPVYVYDIDGFEKRIDTLKKHLPNGSEIHYALKANGHRRILESIKDSGIGLDVVSGGELRQGLECGIPGDKIVFSGVGKTINEIKLAINSNIKQINIESTQELLRIIDIAKELNNSPRIAFRMNPDVDAKTHPYITTGFRENKFGIDFDEMPNLLKIIKENTEYVDFVGLTMHIGSQLRDMSPIKDAIKRLLKLWSEVKEQGFNLKTLDVGGGLGIDYQQDAGTDLANITSYGEMVKELLGDFDGQLLFEPGRILVARCGILLTEIQYIKENSHKNFAIVDTGMHHLMRPCLYQAYHRIYNMVKDEDGERKLYDIVGPICESSDVLGKDRYHQELKQGDILGVLDTGAYGFSMASNYNIHGLPKEIIIKKGQIIED